MGAGAPPWPSRPFSRAPGPPARCRASSSDHHHGRALYKPEITVEHFSSLFCHRRRRLAPPLAAATVEPPPATQTTPSHSPRPRAPHGPTVLALFSPKIAAPLFLVPNSGDRTASRGQHPPPPSSASLWLHCDRCKLLLLPVLFRFRCYRSGSSGRRSP
jgi:hypothetical protein